MRVRLKREMGSSLPATICRTDPSKGWPPWYETIGARPGKIGPPSILVRGASLAPALLLRDQLSNRAAPVHPTTGASTQSPAPPPARAPRAKAQNHRSMDCFERAVQAWSSGEMNSHIHRPTRKSKDGGTWGKLDPIGAAGQENFLTGYASKEAANLGRAKGQGC